MPRHSLNERGSGSFTVHSYLHIHESKLPPPPTLWSVRGLFLPMTRGLELETAQCASPVRLIDSAQLQMEFLQFSGKYLSPPFLTLCSTCCVMPAFYRVSRVQNCSQFINIPCTSGNCKCPVRILREGKMVRGKCWNYANLILKIKTFVETIFYNQFSDILLAPKKKSIQIQIRTFSNHTWL